MAYIVAVSLIPGGLYLSDFGNLEAQIEEWNWVLGWNLVFCLPLFGVAIFALWHFRRMPVFAAIMLIMACWHIVSSLVEYSGPGFDSRFDIVLDPLYFLRTLLVLATPFGIAYAIHRFRRTKITLLHS